MLAAQKLNHESEQIIFGSVTNGKLWQFCKLHLDVFTSNQTFYTIQDLDRLFAATNFLVKQCEQQIELPGGKVKI